VPEKLDGELKVEMAIETGPFPARPGHASITLTP